MRYVLIAISITLGACSPSSTPDYVGTVDWVTDGDTIIVNDVIVRLLGVDTPELDTIEGIIARDFMIDLLFDERVDLFCDGWDRYNRLLCHVHMNGRDVGDLLVSLRLARVWVD